MSKREAVISALILRAFNILRWKISLLPRFTRITLFKIFMSILFVFAWIFRAPKHIRESMLYDLKKPYRNFEFEDEVE